MVWLFLLLFSGELPFPGVLWLLLLPAPLTPLPTLLLLLTPLLLLLLAAKAS